MKHRGGWLLAAIGGALLGTVVVSALVGEFTPLSDSENLLMLIQVTLVAGAIFAAGLVKLISGWLGARRAGHPAAVVPGHPAPVALVTQAADPDGEPA